MKSFAVTTQISASLETVWKILADATNYPSWNPTVEKIEGRIALGQKITVHVKPNSGRPFPVRVSEFVPSRRMVWTGGIPFGLFKGERTFTLSPASDGSVAFSMHEIFDGLLSALIESSIPDLQPAFDEFAAALKKQAESQK